MNLDDAKKKGATALFGEKYKDIVRVVEVGPDSLELCGGCHVGASGEIGFVYIANEGGISSGVRRIECYTGKGVDSEIYRKKQLISELTGQLKCEESKIGEKLLKSLERIKQLEREVEESKSKVANFMISDLIRSAKTTNSGIKVIASVVDTADLQVAREIIDNARVKLGSGVVVVGVKDGDNASILTGVTSDLVKKVNAGDVIKKIVAHAGGRGGGKPDFAQLGGMKAVELKKAIEYADTILGSL